MSRLASIQAQFAGALRGAPLDEGLLRARPNGQPALFHLYSHAYSSRLKQALRDNYPALAGAMGDAEFDALADAYVFSTPSRTPSIRWYGDGIAHFMSREDLGGHPALADLARMEWALRGAFDAADDSVANAAQLAEVDPERWADLRFALHASVRVIHLEWAVEPVWRALEGFAPGGEAVEPEVPEPEEHAHRLLVWRRGLQPHFRSLDDGEAVALEALQAGLSFGEMCARLAPEAGEEEAGLLAAGYLRQWLGEELLSGWSAD